MIYLELLRIRKEKKMKMTQPDYQVLKTAMDNAIEKIGGKLPLQKYYEELKQSGKAKDCDMRLRWDIFYATGLKIGDSVGMPGNIAWYDYLNDDHIDTALRYYMKEIGF